jgi:predicted dehydrogenase
MPIDRRTFVSSAAAGIVAAGTGLSARSQSNVLGANDRITLAFIGAGGMGRSNIGVFGQLPDVRIAAVCDVWDYHAEQASAATRNRPEGTVRTFSDFRRVLDLKEVDAVVVSTPDHWHGIVTIRACEAGKDVFCEKPLAHNIREGRAMVDAARKHGRVVQVGTQQRSGQHYQEAVELVRSGTLGTVTRVVTWNHANEAPHGIGKFPGVPQPQGLDWDMYLGPAPLVPFDAARFLGTFRYFWDYGGGIATDWGVHHLDVVQWAMNVDAPLAVSAAGGTFAIDDARETPDTIEVLYEYPGFVASYSHRGANSRPYNGRGYGIEFYGTDATLIIDRGGYEVIPEMAAEGQGPRKPPFAASMDRRGADPWSGQPRRVRRAKTAPLTAPGSEQNVAHARNFLACMRSRQRPISDVEVAHRSSSTAMLANVALRSGRRIEWDAQREDVTNAPEARKYLMREYRAPWTL